MIHPVHENTLALFKREKRTKTEVGPPNSGNNTNDYFCILVLYRIPLN